MTAAPPPAERRGRFGLPRNVVLLGWTSFFTDVGSEMILAALPQFLKFALHAPMEAIGLIEGIAEATGNGLRLVSGWSADRLGRSKPFVYLGYGLSTVVKPLIALAPAWPFVLGVRFVDRVGKGLRSAPRDALVASSTPKAEFGRAYGFHRMMDTAGAFVGSGITTIAIWAWLGSAAAPGVRWLFAASAVPCALALVFIAPVREPAAAARPRRAASRGAFAPATWWLLAGVALWEMGNISYAFVLIRLTELGVPERLVPAAYVGFNAVYLLAAMPVGAASDRFGIAPTLLGAPLVSGAAFLVFGAGGGWPAAAAGLVLYAAHAAAVNTLPRAAVAHLAPASGRGTLFGLIGVCALASNALAGWLWDHLSSAATMEVAAGCALAATVPFAVVALRRPDED